MATTTKSQVGELTRWPYVLKTRDNKYRIDAELCRLLVPENRHDPNSQVIEIAFVRLPSTAPDPEPPIVELAGGPGGSAISSFTNWSEEMPWWDALRSVCDVILLDQRGVGLSNPRLDSVERVNLPLDRVVTREEYLEAYREASRKTVVYWTERGVDLRGYTTAESADDIDAIRQALGLEKISIIGASYGSHLSLSTVKRHTPRLHKAIIYLVEGPDDTHKLPSNIEKHLRDVAALLKKDPVWGARIPDLIGLMRQVLDRVAQEPVTVEVEDPESKELVKVVCSHFDLQAATAGPLGYDDHLKELPAAYLAMSEGDFSWLGKKAAEDRRSWLGSAMSYYMDCASGGTPERLAQIEREAKDTLLGDAINFPYPAVCDAWGNPDAGEEFRKPVVSDLPTLFMTGELDARTPLSNAEAVMRGFSNAHHILIHGMGHDTPNVPEVRQAVVDFLRGEPVTITEATKTGFNFDPPASD
jgi:pimeloyl-ACP methyl ester carboxylesterase